MAGEAGGKAKEVLSLVGLVLVGLVAVVALGFAAQELVERPDGSAAPCGKQPSSNLAGKKAPRWKLARPRGAKLSIELSYHVGEPRRANTSVAVRALGKKKPGPLPERIRVGAFVRGGGLSNGAEGMGFAPVAIARRARDGRSVEVELCVERPEERDLSAPGRYTGHVRVAGPKLRAVDVPVAVSIKAGLVSTAVIAILVSIVGALMPLTTKPEDATEEDLNKRKRLQQFLGVLPFLSGVAAGCLAALLVYADDPTWGAQRGADTIKLVVAAYAAATAGLAATALPTKATRKAIASRPASS